MNKIRSKEKIILIIALIAVIITVIGSITYAMWIRSYEQTTSNLVSTGCFELTFSEGDEISLDNAFPMTYKEGMKTAPYTFTLSNECNINAEYQINLEVLDITMAIWDINGALNRNFFELEEEVDPTINDAVNAYKLKQGVIEAGETVTYDLRLWLSEQVYNNDVSSQVFESKITIIATPTTKKSLGIEPLVLGSPNMLTFNDVINVGDGYVVVGNTLYWDWGEEGNPKAATIRKYDKDGEVIWSSTYNYEKKVFFNSIIEADGGYVVIGDLRKGNDGTTGVIAKYDTTGNLLWDDTVESDSDVYFNSVIEVSDGYIVAVTSDGNDGDIVGNKGYNDGILLKYDKSGNRVWQKHFGGSDYDFFSAIIKESDGFVVLGAAFSENGDIIDNSAGYGILVKYNFAGNIIWQKHFGGEGGDNYHSIIKATDGYIILGYDYTNESDAQIVKCDFSGNELWRQSLSGFDHPKFKSVIEVSDGYVVVGYYAPEDYDAIIVKYDFSGNLLWSKTFGRDYNVEYASVIELDGNYIAIGSALLRDGGFTGKSIYRDGVLVKYDADGNVIYWETIGTSGVDEFYKTIIDGNKLILVGNTNNSRD